MRDTKRDLGQELLQSVREMKAGRRGRVHKPGKMSLQAEYDLRIAQPTIGPEVDKRVQRHAA